MSPRSGRPRTARRALESARRAPARSGALRGRIADVLASFSDEEQHILALLVGERLNTAETALALEVPASRVMLMRAMLFESLRRALKAEPLPARLGDAFDTQSLRKAS